MQLPDMPVPPLGPEEIESPVAARPLPVRPPLGELPGHCGGSGRGSRTRQESTECPGAQREGDAPGCTEGDSPESDVCPLRRLPLAERRISASLQARPEHFPLTFEVGR